VIGTAATVNDALCQAEITGPDLAIVDVRLPGDRDGIEGAKLLRQQFGIPVIFLTGEINKLTVQRAAENQLVTAVHIMVGAPSSGDRAMTRHFHCGARPDGLRALTVGRPREMFSIAKTASRLRARHRPR
jgi:CheY-like chemotaxis protein